MPTNQEQLDRKQLTSSDARETAILMSSVCAWGLELLLIYFLWSGRGLSASFYILPVAHPLPWIAARRWLRIVRRKVKSGDLEESAASTCSDIVSSLLVGTYLALGIIELSLGSAWRFTRWPA